MPNRKNRFRLLALTAFAAVSLAACGGNDGNPTAAGVSQLPGASADISPATTDATDTGTGAGAPAPIAPNGSVTLTWDPATENTDGSPLSDLSGYRVYWGTREDTYPNSATIHNPGLATYVVGELAPARWFFVVTTLSMAGTESDFSNIYTTTVL